MRLAGIVGSVAGLTVGCGHSGTSGSAPLSSSPVSASSTPSTAPTAGATSGYIRAHGNIDPFSLPLTGPSITAVRPNGETIQVPAKLNFTDTNQLVSATLDLLNCYYTTGSDECLNAATDLASLKQDSRNFRQEHVSIEVNSGYANVQAATFDTPDELATFDVQDAPNGKTVELTGGKIYFQRELENKNWQDFDTRDMHPEGYYDTFKMVFAGNPQEGYMLAGGTFLHIQSLT